MNVEISPKTTIHSLIKEYPFLVEYLGNYRPEFSRLANPVMRRSMGRVATLERVAALGSVQVEQLLGDIAAEIELKTGTRPAVVHERSADPRRQEALKSLIRDLHAGADPSDVKRRFSEIIEDIDASEIAAMEQALVAEGMAEEEIKDLCDVHVSVFRDALGTHEEVKVPAGHPIHTFHLENEALGEVAKRLDHALTDLGPSPTMEGFERQEARLTGDLEQLDGIRKHYLRKENQLFPMLEKHGVVAPPKVMWAIHDDIRTLLTKVRAAIADRDIPAVVEYGPRLVSAVTDMIYKEENIMFPMSMEVLTDDDWKAVAGGEKAIGYALVQPAAEWPAEDVAAQEQETAGAGLELNTGVLTTEQINVMLETLPLDISFVDEHDTVRFYSEGMRVFPRSPGVIGRTVQNCHPKKSVDKVQEILDAFRSGAKDVAEFWIEQDGHFIHIRYFAMRDADGAYRGALELVQDATEIRALKGQRRLLDW